MAENAPEPCKSAQNPGSGRLYHSHSITLLRAELQLKIGRQRKPTVVVDLEHLPSRCYRHLNSPPTPAR